MGSYKGDTDNGYSPDIDVMQLFALKKCVKIAAPMVCLRTAAILLLPIHNVMYANVSFKLFDNSLSICLALPFLLPPYRCAFRSCPFAMWCAPTALTWSTLL